MIISLATIASVRYRKMPVFLGDDLIGRLPAKSSIRIRPEFENSEIWHGDNVCIPIAEVISQQSSLHVWQVCVSDD